MISAELLEKIKKYLAQNYVEPGEHDKDASSNFSDSIKFCSNLDECLSGSALRNFRRDSAPMGSSSRPLMETADECIALVEKNVVTPSLEDWLSNMDEGFGQTLVKLIDARGMTDADCYKKALINRSLFNRIKNDPQYHVQKDSAFALALALKLNLEEAEAFIGKAGFAFSSNSKTDLIVQYCIINRLYDVMEVNELLFKFDQKLLGSGKRE